MLRARLRGLSRRQKIGGIAGAVVVVLGAAAGISAAALSGSPQPKKAAVKPPASSSTTTVQATEQLCPLTGTRAPGNVVPKRPAIGIKIGNDAASRPQSGLDKADIVYEEMAEGGITRYLAVYQCQAARSIGPVRSVRWDDWHVLASYGHPILAFSGGIDQWNDVVSHLHWLYDANASFYPAASAYHRYAGREPPWNLYTSTASLYKLDPKMKSPPKPQFSYTASPGRAFAPSSGLSIPLYAGGQTVDWRWSPSKDLFERFYGSSPDVLASGVPVTAKNVVVQMVVTHEGPYAESGTVPDTDSITEGSGVAYVFRNGKYLKGTWKTPQYGDVMELYSKSGQPISLTPGNTWVEMVPESYAVKVAH